MPDWMAFNVADYVANTMHLSARQHGGYILLICAAWSGKGRLPSNEAALMAIAKLDQKAWQEDGPALLAFLTRRGDELLHERVEFEWNDAHALIASKSKAGKEGARRRWHGRGNGKPMAEPSQTHRQNDAPLPEPLPSSEAKASGADAPSTSKDLIFAEMLPWLSQRQGKDCRSLVGRWLSDTKDDDAMLGLLRQAKAENPVDPSAWIAVRLKPQKPHENWNDRRIREAREAVRNA